MGQKLAALAARENDKAKSERLAKAVSDRVGPPIRFKKFRSCQKCGEDNIKRDWCPGFIPEIAEGTCRIETGEHLECQCQACGFRWREETADFLAE